MVLRKDKQKVLGEVFDDERIKTFLDYAGSNNPDYHLLERAYRGMKADNFGTFLDFFIEQGYSINAKNPQGQTFLTVISSHRQADDYIVVMKERGAE